MAPHNQPQQIGEAALAAVIAAALAAGNLAPVALATIDIDNDQKEQSQQQQEDDQPEEHEEAQPLPQAQPQPIIWTNTPCQVCELHQCKLRGILYTYEQLYDHNMAKHRDNLHCKLCWNIFDNLINGNNEPAPHVGPYNIECVYCDAKFDRGYDYSMHFGAYHRYQINTKEVCMFCSQFRFRNWTQQINHLLTEHAVIINAYESASQILMSMDPIYFAGADMVEDTANIRDIFRQLEAKEAEESSSADADNERSEPENKKRKRNE